MNDPGRAYFIVDEEGLRQKILELSPEMRRDTERLADLLRELVKFEREKAGLDNPSGRIELYPNSQKSHPTQPDLIGTGWVGGKFYQAAAWIGKTDKIKIALQPAKTK